MISAFILSIGILLIFWEINIISKCYVSHGRLMHIKTDPEWENAFSIYNPFCMVSGPHTYLRLYVLYTASLFVTENAITSLPNIIIMALALLHVIIYSAEMKGAE